LVCSSLISIVLSCIFNGFIAFRHQKCYVFMLGNCVIHLIFLLMIELISMLLLLLLWDYHILCFLYCSCEYLCIWCVDYTRLVPVRVRFIYDAH